ncbi:MAG TPA: PilZ domain-containing protein [Candidatus Omnitrophota bacterium]|nr:PilZ domain-containing protein [Candidatus Omnitrophota bacterium]HPB67422.1 PilZ domain-containing protein [Candidatus Omnitrophota bacterium]HQO58095.1 PilZ domain-containing protein [Candidatus Omnitrophota bacterium]
MEKAQPNVRQAASGYTGQEKRYLPRWEVNNRVLCRTDEGFDSVECRSMDLSCAGVCLVMRQRLQPAEKVKLTIYLTEAKAVEVDGHVAWSRVSGYGNLAGISFENTELEIQDTILKYAFEFKKNTLVQHWFEGWQAGAETGSDPSSPPPQN